MSDASAQVASQSPRSKRRRTDYDFLTYNHHPENDNPNAAAGPAEGSGRHPGSGNLAGQETSRTAAGASAPETAPDSSPRTDTTIGLPHPRLAALSPVRVVLDDVVPLKLCRELVFIFRATSTVGYRPHVLSATIHDVAATAPWLLPSLVRARQAVLSAVEAAFDLSLELAVEFSGLIGWTRGSQLGWHHDANRAYLSRRHLSAVLYLNDQGVDFGGGDFRFQDGEGPLRVVPRAGRLVAYTADARNVHCVDSVDWGERCTLTLWFSLDPSAAEDSKVLEQLSRNPHLQPGGHPPPPPSPPPSGATPQPRQLVRRPTHYHHHHHHYLQPRQQPDLSLAQVMDAAMRSSGVEAAEPGLAAEASTPATGTGALLSAADHPPGAPPEPGAPDAVRAPLRRRAWWRGLAPGLPDTMYRLPGPAVAHVATATGASGAVEGGPEAEAEGVCGAGWSGGDVRLVRLQTLGLLVMRQPAGDENPGGSTSWKTSPLAPFAVHRLGLARLNSVEQLAAAEEELSALVAEGLRQVGEALPGWMALGSLLDKG